MRHNSALSQPSRAYQGAALSPLLSTLGLIALLGASMAGCDDDPPPTSTNYRLAFQSPLEGASLGCGDDQDRATPTLIDRDLVLEVDVPADERPELTVELTAEGASWSPQRRGVSLSGEVIFSDLPLAEGEYELKAILLNAEEVRAEATIAVSVAIDSDDPLCAVSTSELSFVTPAIDQTFTGADDLDGDLTNGLQVRAEVEVLGPLVNDLVELQVDGVPQRATTARNGVAVFEQITLPVPQANAAQRVLRAVAQSPNGLVEASVSVNVEASSCELTLSPEPVEGCDLSAVDDQDPTREGVQTTLRATTTCAQVVWIVNGVTYPPAEVVNGEAAINVTLNEGENTVSATARSANGLAGEAPTYTLDVNPIAPSVAFEGLSALSEATFGLGEATEVLEGDRARWTLNGFTSQLDEGALVLLNATPAIDGLPESVMVNAQGRFELPIEASYLCGVTLTPSVTDPCGGVQMGEAYELCFDAVRPTISLSTPYGDDLILSNQDVSPSREGLQVYLPVRVEDSREGVDYPLEVACRLADEGGALSVVSDEPVMRSALRPVSAQEGVFEGEVLISLNTLGNYECLVQASTGINAPVTPVLSLRAFDVAPVFELIDPLPLNDSPVCASSALRIGGFATDVDPSDVRLAFTLRNAAGDVARQGSLAALSEGFFGAQVALGANGLADGRYTLEVSGESAGVAIAVRPAQLDVVVSTANPSLGVSSPSEGAIDVSIDSDGDLNNCVQAPVTVALTDPGASALCYSMNRAVPTCLPLSAEQLEAGSVTLPELSFVQGDNTLALTLQTCSAPEGERSVEVSFEYNVEGCEPTLRLTRPVDGRWVTPSDDEDAVRAGVQLSVTVSGSAGEEVTVEVSDAEGQALSESEPVTLNDAGIGVTVITLPETFEERTLTLTPRAERVGLPTLVSQRLNELSFELIPPAIADEGGEACINTTTLDASIASGFQARFLATGSGLSTATAPRLSVSCEGSASVTTEGALATQLGRFVDVTFPAVTLSEGACTATATALLLSGEEVNSEVSFTFDREAPEVRLNTPLEATPLTLSQDTDLITRGLQIDFGFEVCGASGQTVTLSTTPEQAEGALSVTLNEGVVGCQPVIFEDVTLTAGLAQPVSVSVSDACGNTTTERLFFEVNTSPLLTIVSPQNESTLSVVDDQNTERAGCQITVDASSTGFADLTALEVALCTSGEGEGESALCGTDPDVSEGSCRAIDTEGRQFRCDVSLTDGAHTLTLVSREAGVLSRSAPISVYADCTAPQLTQLQVLQDLNADGCVNRQERANVASVSANAAVQVSYVVSGLADQSSVSLRERSTGALIAQSVVNGGQGLFESVTLTPGEHELYLTARDEANNTLPAPGEPGFTSVQVRVDTTAPAPALLSPEAGVCLGVDVDLNEAASGLQLRPLITTGGDGTDTLSAVLTVDGQERQRVSTQSLELSFDEVQLNQGAHQLSVVVYDSCGNAGSVAGFALDEGLPVWSAPQSVPVEVDTIAPTLSVLGLTSGEVVDETRDANQNATDGFQLDVNVLATGLEAGGEVQLFSGEARLSTTPERITVSGSAPQLVPVRVTLPPGLHAISARAVDECGNSAQSAPIGLTVNISGCASTLVGLTPNQAIGPNVGAVEAGGVRLNINGQVDLFNPACGTGNVSLLSDGAEVASATVGAAGEVSFSDVLLSPGAQNLRLRVTAEGESTESLGVAVRVDATAPLLSLSAPAGDAQNNALVLNDEDPSTPNSQQVSFEVTVSEAQVVTPRLARLSLNGVTVREDVELSAATNTLARFGGVTIPAGVSPFEVCVSDEAGNERCLNGSITADLSAPTSVVATVVVGDPRVPEVEVSFDASSDDVNGGGAAQRYQMRWSRSPIPDGDEGAWSGAMALPTVEASVGVGEREVVNLDGRFAINELVYLAIRAEDDQGRLSAVRSVSVDARMPRVSYSIPSAGAAWVNTEDLFNSSNALASLGDFNGDGLPDLLVAANQISGASTASVLFGNADTSALELQPLTYTAGTTFNASGASAVGDVNGDGAPDLAVLSYLGDFSGAEVSIYFGCTAAAPCAPTSAQLLSPDVSLTSVGSFRSFISGGGDVNGDGFDDLIIGGDTSPVSPDHLNVVLGRAAWAPTLDVLNASVPNGVLSVQVPGSVTIGAYSVIAADLDGDDTDDLAFSVGGAQDRTFVAYGVALSDAAANTGTLSFTGLDPDFIELTNPCETLPSGLTADAFGTYLRSADVNADGAADLLIGNRINKQLIVMGGALDRLDCFTRNDDNFGVFFDVGGDFNGDGNPDLIASHNDNSATNALVFFNDGFGAFGENNAETQRAPSVRVNTPALPKLAVSWTGDINGDGRDDLAYLTWGANNEPELSVLY